jgi:hypothetical protein
MTVKAPLGPGAGFKNFSERRGFSISYPIPEGWPGVFAVFFLVFSLSFFERER